MYERASIAQHRNDKENENLTLKMKTTISLGCSYSSPHWNAFRRSSKTQSARLLSASYPTRPNRHHLATSSVWVELSSLSATVSTFVRLP